MPRRLRKFPLLDVVFVRAYRGVAPVGAIPPLTWASVRGGPFLLLALQKLRNLLRFDRRFCLFSVAVIPRVKASR